MSEEYNGWSNWETWNASMWLDESFAARADSFAEEIGEGMTEKDNAIRSLAEEIESYVDEITPELPAGLMADFLSASIRELNYKELAEHFLDLAIE